MTAGRFYFAFADATAKNGAGSVAIRFLDGTGAALTSTAPGATVARDHSGRASTTGTAPAGAVAAQVVLATDKEASFDNVRVTSQLTDLGAQVAGNVNVNTTTFGKDAGGRTLMYGVTTGSTGFDARLTAVDVVSGAVTLNLPVPGATGAWDAVQASDGSIYVAGYNFGAFGGHLYRYVPDSAAVVDVGAPKPGDTFAYGLAADGDGGVYGGTAPSAKLFSYNPARGFGQIGAQPILPGIMYLRSTAFDPTTGLVFAGTGLTAHVIACHTSAPNGCVDILPAAYETAQWAYKMTAGDGRVLIDLWDAQKIQHVLVLKVAVAADGTVSSTVEADLAPVNYPGPSAPVNGAFYYSTASGMLTKYDLATGAVSDLAQIDLVVNDWGVEHLSDQTTYPGDTVVGISAAGVMVRYNTTTKAMTKVDLADAVPGTVTDLESLATTQGGDIYSSGGFGGGLGFYSPATTEQRGFRAALGFEQAEGMVGVGKDVYQGIYPGGRIVKLTPSTTPATVPPTITPLCDFHLNRQDRPFAMLAAAGKIWAGTTAVSGYNAGGLSTYDPATGGCEFLGTPVPDQSVIKLASKDGIIYGGTSIAGGSGSTPTQKEAKIFRYDPSTRATTVIDLPVHGKRAVSGLVFDARGVLWVTAEDMLFSYDPTTGTWLSSRSVFPDVSFASNDLWGNDGYLMQGRDGYLYGIVLRQILFRIDPATGAVTRLLAGAFMGMTVDNDGGIYTILNGNRLLRYQTMPTS